MFGSRERLYNSWVTDHYRFLFRSAWALTGNRVVAEEVVQDCFEIAWRRMDQLRDKSSARAWLFQVLRREALRNLGPAVELYDESADEREGNDAVAVLEQRLDILSALQALPAIHREVLTLFYFEDMPVSEMAIALEIAPGTVLSRLNRAREGLRYRMEPVAAPASASASAPAAVAGSGQVIEFPSSARAVGDE